MRQMSQISIDNYFGTVKQNLTEREKWVLEAIEEIAPCTNEDVASHLGVLPNVTSGRFTGLRKKGYIVSAFRGLNNRGAKVQFWKPKNTPKEYDDVY